MRLWDLASRQEARVFNGHKKPVWAVAFTPDAARALSAGYDEVVKLWNVATGQPVALANSFSASMPTNRLSRFGAE